MKNMYNDVLAEGTDYTVTIKDATSTELTEVTELGEYILTVNGTGNYMGSKSIYFYVYAQRDLGAAKTSAYYAVAPFIGVALSFVIFREIPGALFFIALVIMIAGTWMVNRE